MNRTEGTLMRESRLRIITVRSSGTKLKNEIYAQDIACTYSRTENLSAVSRSRAMMNV